ncbi:MAG: type 1 glutamine amidotransferase [Inquilinus sp.]|nr:type 1 glutamine amidotransferase [Inquilinus sp.]
MTEPRILVVEGNTKAVRDATVEAGGRVTAELYVETLEKCFPGARCDTVRPTDTDAALADSTGLADYDGIAWTGSALNIYNREPAVDRQIKLGRAALASGVPVFGSCWGLQVAVTAAGGEVAKNPIGREFGLARKIALNEAGRAHPLYDGKASVFDAVAVHKDEVVALPAGTTVLAGNGHSEVQALEFSVPGGSTFWGVQYHPEFDLREISAIARRYGTALTEEGFFADAADADRYAEMTAALQADPGRRDLAWLLGADADVLDGHVRLAEIRNWIMRQVLPRLADR